MISLVEVCCVTYMGGHACYLWYVKPGAVLYGVVACQNDILSRSVLCYLYGRSCMLLMVCETWCCFVLCCCLSK